MQCILLIIFCYETEKGENVSKTCSSPVVGGLRYNAFDSAKKLQVVQLWVY